MKMIAKAEKSTKVDRDAWELSDDSDETQCGSCGSYIEYERVITVEYNTYPKKCTTVIKVD